DQSAPPEIYTLSLHDALPILKAYDNICKYIHLPVQSGSSRILRLMNRTYDRAWYLQKIKDIRDILGSTCGISSDMIAGFCTETRSEEHTSELQSRENLVCRLL